MTRSHIVDGRRLESAYIAPARPELPTVVMLHEGLGSVAHWKDFPQRLAAETGAGVFLYSRYGHGQSDRVEEPRPVSYLHHEARTVLPAILDQAGIERPLLFGHSDGASIALIYGGTFPASPAGMILEAPHVFVEDVTVAGVAQAKVAYQTTDLPRRLGRYHADVDSLFRAWNGIWLNPEFRDWNIESCLDSIRCPVLVIQGVDDEFGTVRQVDAIQAKIPAAEVVMLPACGHSPHRDQPAVVLAKTVEFLHHSVARTI